MNREEKLEFIKEHHPDLYLQLEQEVTIIVDNICEANSSDFILYNEIVTCYCGKLMDPYLLKQLTIY